MYVSQSVSQSVCLLKIKKKKKELNKATERTARYLVSHRCTIPIIGMF